MAGMGTRTKMVEPHWCLLLRQFHGAGQPDVCPMCKRPFPDKWR